MMIKLLKREWKATYRIFLLLYLSVVVVSLLGYGSFQWGNELVQTFSSFILVMGVMPVVVIYCVTIFSGYEKSMYGDEAYLTHTLPVKARQMLLGKWIMATFWGVATVLVGALCGGMLLFLALTPHIALADIMASFQRLFGVVPFSKALLMVLMALLTCIQFIVKIYFCVAVSKLAFIHRFQSLVALVVFALCTFVQNKIYDLLGNQWAQILLDRQFGTHWDSATTEILAQIYSTMSLYHTIFTVVLAIVYFALTAYLLEKKLHIR